MYAVRRRCRQLPQGGGAVVAQCGCVAAGEDGGHPLAFVRQLELPDCVDAPVDPAKAPARDSVPNGVVGEGKSEQLASCDYAMLLADERRGVWLVSFGCYDAEKSPTGPGSPPAAAGHAADPRPPARRGPWPIRARAGRGTWPIRGHPRRARAAADPRPPADPG